MQARCALRKSRAQPRARVRCGPRAARARRTTARARPAPRHSAPGTARRAPARKRRAARPRRTWLAAAQLALHRRELLAAQAVDAHRVARVALGEEDVHRAEHLLELRRGAGGKEDSQHPRIVVPEVQGRAVAAIDERQRTQVIAQPAEALPRGDEASPVVPPSRADQPLGELAFKAELHQVGGDLSHVRLELAVEQALYLERTVRVQPLEQPRHRGAVEQRAQLLALVGQEAFEQLLGSRGGHDSAVADLAERRAALRRHLEHLRLRGVRGGFLPFRRLGRSAALRLARLLGKLGLQRRGAGAAPRGAARIDLGERALNGHAARVDVDEVAPDLHADLGVGLENQDGARLQVDLVLGVVGELGHLAEQVLGEVEREGAVLQLLVAIAAVERDVVVAVLQLLVQAALLDVKVAVLSDPFLAHFLDPYGLVLLRLDEDLLRAFLVLEAQLVEVRGRALRGRMGLDAALRLFRRQRVGRAQIAVVEAAGDDG